MSAAIATLYLQTDYNEKNVIAHLFKAIVSLVFNYLQKQP